MKKWKILKDNFSFNDRNSLIIELLKNRGIEKKKDIQEFLNPNLETITPEKIDIAKKELQKAIKRIKKSIKGNETIVIYGDYDVDGICGTGILWESIYKIYKNVLPYIPDRVDEGYGLSEKGIQNLESRIQNVKLIITVDNGIVANRTVEHANKKGIDVIITDHHALPKKLPKAYAIVHSTQVCGAAIAYLLAQVLNSKQENDCLELVALATVADLVPLVGLNRTLVRYGLEKLRETKREGLLALLKIAGIKKEKIGVYELGYIIGPRINAMGRIASGMDSLRLICTSNKEKALGFANSLNSTNRERQVLTEETTIHAKSFSTNGNLTSKIIFVSHAEYNQGVIGLVASKLVEEYYRPSFVLSIGEKLTKGSARSIRGVNIIELIRSVSSDLLVDAGGHPMAAGFTVETDKIEKFRQELELRANEVVTDDLLQKTVIVDLPLEFENISFELYKKIEQLSPFGIGNPEPTFVARKVKIANMKLVGAEGKHLKLRLSQEGQRIRTSDFGAIAFGMGQKSLEMQIGQDIDLVYTIEEDKWNGNGKLQLKVKDLRISS